jgi:hypothetical protein
MGFLSPWFLAGLAAVGLPIWLHLLRKHRADPEPFSSLMFFERRTQSSIKHRRLHYLLLFALRTALLVMLALAFAGLFVTGKLAPAGRRKMIVLAVDHSFSMRQGDRLSRAKQEALGVLSRMQAGDQAQVVEFANQVRVVGQPTTDPVSLRAGIDTIEETDSRSSYGELVRALRSVAQSSHLPLEIHLFSDMQKSSLPPGFVDLQLPAGTGLLFHPLADERLPNWTVESVNSPRRLYDPKKVRVRATIAGFGTEAAERRVSLVVNDKVLETKTVKVPSGGRATVEFLSLDAPYGLNRGEVRLDSNDSFPHDDRFFFSIERSDRKLVLFVHEARDTRSPLYFRAALEASSQAAFRLDAIIAQQTAGVTQLKYAFVVLSNVTSIPKVFEERLRKYVRGGGSVLIALGSATAVRGEVPLFEGAILQSRYSSRRGGRFQMVSWVDPAHPSIRRANRWDGVKFYQVLRVDPGSARIVARVTDQTPVLLERQISAGRVLVFASTFDNISNDFPLHASFVPFVEQTAQYLGGLEDRPGSLPVDAYLELRTAHERGTAVEVIDPHGRRALDLSTAATAQDLLLEREGFYEVRRSNGQQELVAANADRQESDFEAIPNETLSLWQNTGQSPVASSGAITESLVASRYLATRKEGA